MNELIKITEVNGSNVVSAKSVHEFVEMDTRFDIWIKRMLEYGFIENNDYQCLNKNVQMPNGGTKVVLQDYALSLNCAKEICMIQKNDKGKQARQYFIDCERELINQQRLPATYIKALEALVESEKAKLLLQENINQLEPKAEVYDNIVACENLKAISEVAKLLNTGQNRFFEWLRGANILMTNNLPFQQYVEQGYLVVKTHPIATLKKDYSQTYFTAKGEVWITKRYLKD